MSPGRPPFLTYMRGQFRFGWWWLPAVAVGGLIQYRAGGLLRLVLLLLVATPLCIVFATWWEWRKVE